MNSANLEKSERLQRTLAVLKDGKPHSTMDIIAQAQVCAVNSIAAELRENGYPVLCERRGSAWYYQLAVPANG